VYNLLVCNSTIYLIDTPDQYPVEHPPHMPPCIRVGGASRENHFPMPIPAPETVDSKIFFEKKSGRKF